MILAPVLVDDIEDYFRHGFDPDDPTVHFSEGELVGIPKPVFAGMYVASWARAEMCPVYAERGCLDLYRRHEPSSALYSEFGRWRGAVSGSLGWAIPYIRPPQRGLVALCCPPPCFGIRGAMGAN